ncbi:hypothetical protein DL766_002249 [Monosporascus sp. MC13-8B]|nr:hypothetical protein DL763_004127 [Monosporascus cannonballus]RYP35979.1 hypothetical protein DL766_002249 [Monosporascus sp. MC13-8B]
MRFSWLLEKTSLLTSVFLTTETSIDDSDSSVKQVAIIGAGAAGSSAAYHLRRYAEEAGIPINITVFEKTPHIGGRTLTVNVYDDPLSPVELGASIFIDANHILVNATREFNLSTAKPGTDEKGDLAIWDGNHFVFRQNSNSWGWWNLAKLFWKYGTAPYYTDKLMRETVATFLKLYKAPYFPFRSLSERAYELGLTKITGLTGEQFLAENKIDSKYAHDIVQASTRVNYASNLARIHGLGAMVSMAPEGAMQVTGGNWQIFSKMVEASNARILLNSPVTSIELKESSDPDSKASKYVIKTASPGSWAGRAETHSVGFDDVVIAAPYQFSGIKSANDLIEQPIDEIPYATLHVTLFASPFRFSSKFFKQAPATEVPTSVLTTLAESDEGADGAGLPGFYSATLVKVVTNPKTLNTEYVYKIFSPEKVSPEFLSSLLGVTVPDTFTGPADASGEEGTEVVEPISWYHPAVFHPYPVKYPRVTFQDPILRDGLYYTSGIESFISTMETSALMGMNVARLIVDDYLASSSPAETNATDTTDTTDTTVTTEPVVMQIDHEQYVLEEQQNEVPESYGQPFVEQEDHVKVPESHEEPIAEQQEQDHVPESQEEPTVEQKEQDEVPSIHDDPVVEQKEL